MALVSIVDAARKGVFMNSPTLVAGSNLCFVQLKISAGFDGEGDS